MNELTVREKLAKTRKKLDAISPSFCLAKWLQVTIHLQTGMTHSCHHPSPHKIPLNEIKANASALHNTSFKKRQRQLMLDGIRPKECDYCWNIEDASPNSFSDRHFKSSERWSYGRLNEISEMPWNQDINPTYLEVSFSHVCNFKCSYCAPNISSKWMEEIKQHGAYPTSIRHNNLEWIRDSGQMPIPVREHNPYVEAFWKWWPDVYPNLKIFRVTGGEPLLSRDLFKVLDYFIETPSPELEFAVNTNLGVPDELLDVFINKIKIIIENNCVKRVKIFTSAEAWGDKAAYIRHGMEFDKFWLNVQKILTELPECDLTFMSTFNALSLTSYKQFLEGIIQLKTEFYNEHRPHGVFVDTPYLRSPEHQAIKILPLSYIKYMDEIIDYMNASKEIFSGQIRGFHDFEIERVTRIKDWMLVSLNDEKLSELRSDFYMFFNEHDKRRNVNFLNVFPEMKDFWQLCKKESEKRD